MKEATTWPDAGIAIAGIGMVSAIGMIFVWQVFRTLRIYLAMQNDEVSRSRASVQTQGDRG